MNVCQRASVIVEDIFSSNYLLTATFSKILATFSFLNFTIVKQLTLQISFQMWWTNRFLCQSDDMYYTNQNMATVHVNDA